MDVGSQPRDGEGRTESASRDDLTSRVLPQMVLGDGTKPGSPTAPPPPLPRNGTPTTRALERFRVTGNAIVTGGVGDLGYAASCALFEHGLQGLVIFDMNADAAAAKIRNLEAQFPEARIGFVRVDVTDAKAVGAAVAESARLLGGSIDHLVSFAGIVSCQHALNTPPADWDKVLGVNTTGGFLVAQAVAQQMVQQNRGGTITLVASVSGHRVNFPQPQVAYNVSKAAVVAMVKSLAAEWAHHGIRVNSISPGYMDTVLNEGDGLEEAKKIWLGRNPMGRMGQPDELAGTVVLLASRAGSYINGADILVDGGQSVF